MDRHIGAASCAGADGGFVSYDNPETVKMEAAYCQQKGLSMIGASPPPFLFCFSSLLLVHRVHSEFYK